MREINYFLRYCIAASLLALPAVYAQTPTTTFQLNQENQFLELNTKEFETIYRTDQVPDTCYRDEVQGTRTECHTTYDNVCNTTYERVCRNVAYPVCNRVPRNVCTPINDCRTVNDRVCNSQGCVNVPRRVCSTRTECHTGYDNVCYTQYRTECNDVPRQSCTNVPRQVCTQVPNVVKVPYACTRPVQVPAGQNLKLHTIAKLNVQFMNYGNTGATPDLFVASLASGQVTIKLQNPQSAQYLYQVVSQTRNEQMVSQTEKVITVNLSLQAISIQQLNSFGNAQIVNPKLSANKIEFSLANPFNLAFRGHLKLLQIKNARKSYVVVDEDFKSSAIVGQGSLYTMALNSFGVSSLANKLHEVELNLLLDLSNIQSGLINPEGLALVNATGAKVAFESYP